MKTNKGNHNIINKSICITTSDMDPHQHLILKSFQTNES